MSCMRYFVARTPAAALTVLGLACTLIVMEIQRLPVAHVVSFSMFAPVPYLAEAFAVAALGLASPRRPETAGCGAALRWAIAASAVVSTWLLVWCAPSEDGTMLAIRSFYRIATGLLVVLWGEWLLALGARRAACAVAAACLASGALTAVLAVAPALLMEVVLGLLPLGAAVPLLVLRTQRQPETKENGRAEKATRPNGHGSDRKKAGKTSAASATNGASSPDSFLDKPLPSFDMRTPRDRVIMAGLIALPLICRGPMVAFQSTWISLQQSAEAGVTLQAVIGIGIMVGGLIVALIVRYVWNQSFVLVFDLFVLPVSLVSFYTASLTDALWPLHLLIVDSTYKVCLFYMFMAPFLFAGAGSAPSRPSVAPLCWFFAVMIAVRALFSGLVQELSDPTYMIVNVIVVLATFVVAGTLAFASVSRNLAQRAQASAPAAPPAPDELKARCAQLADRFDLTPREREILLLLAQHYRAPYIAEKLVVSQSTVKTHMRNLYGKLDVHSQAELLLLVERESE